MTFTVNYGDGVDWSHVQSVSFRRWHHLSSPAVNGNVRTMELFHSHKKCSIRFFLCNMTSMYYIVLILQHSMGMSTFSTTLHKKTTQFIEIYDIVFQVCTSIYNLIFNLHIRLSTRRSCNHLPKHLTRSILNQMPGS